MRAYRELMQFDSFEMRLKYLKLTGAVGAETFGSNRGLNQRFYSSHQWRLVRDHVITRDYGRDLGLEGFEIYGKPIVHHMNPVSIEDLLNGSELVLDPEFLITVSHDTHNLIHYGNERQTEIVERKAGDTKLW